MTQAVELFFPFTGWWRARNSPARRVPSHGSHMLGTTYSIDFIGLSGEKRTAPWSLSTAFGLEDPAAFPSFGREILAPVDGVVVQAWDGIADHEARRSQLQLVPYMLGQQRRLREGGVRAITGNAVVIQCSATAAFVALVHLKRDSVRVATGDTVRVGDVVGECGNSGNSTQPHVHVQVTDSQDWEQCTGLQMLFRSRMDESPWMPKENEVFYVEDPVNS
ncbi:M23 family metallopeptidase [Corynebacterium glaucum]|uniref:M23 family metallopeptidase n=1 Tax=Corynebacterium glaucum TaxID=187491 RepID=UPI0026583E4B|nr:M23 family metallopeptidase [Corynebacterium glaucum]